MFSSRRATAAGPRAARSSAARVTGKATRGHEPHEGGRAGLNAPRDGATPRGRRQPTPRATGQAARARLHQAKACSKDGRRAGFSEVLTARPGCSPHDGGARFCPEARAAGARSRANALRHGNASLTQSPGRLGQRARCNALLGAAKGGPRVEKPRWPSGHVARPRP